MASISNLDTWLLMVYEKSRGWSDDHDAFFHYVCFHLWEIWKQRCHAVMKKVSPNPVTKIEGIHRNFREWMEVHNAANDLSLSTQEQAHRTSWHPPVVDYVKINVDASWKAGKQQSGLGIVVRNHRGLLVAGASLLGSHNSAIEAEADSVVRGLLFAASLNLKKVIIEGDCQEVMKPLADQSHDGNWRISVLLGRAKGLVSLFDDVFWNWVPREANRAADAAAKLAMVRLCSSEWASMPPTSLLHVLRNDGLPSPP